MVVKTDEEFDVGDVLYTCLPLYHSAGGALGAMSCFMSGATMALAKKFSAARFWREISEQQCTAFQYIGALAEKTMFLKAMVFFVGKRCRSAVIKVSLADTW